MRIIQFLWTNKHFTERNLMKKLVISIMALLLLAGPVYATIALSDGWFIVTGEVLEGTSGSVMVKIETGNVLTVDSLPELKKGDKVSVKIHISGTEIDSAVLMGKRE